MLSKTFCLSFLSKLSICMFYSRFLYVCLHFLFDALLLFTTLKGVALFTRWVTVGRCTGQSWVVNLDEFSSNLQHPAVFLRPPQNTPAKRKKPLFRPGKNKRYRVCRLETLHSEPKIRRTVLKTHIFRAPRKQRKPGCPRHNKYLTTLPRYSAILFGGIAVTV